MKSGGRGTVLNLEQITRFLMSFKSVHDSGEMNYLGFQTKRNLDRVNPGASSSLSLQKLPK